ncbi:hypothetical protein FSP39_006208 [Pinctada imbricata]|uniref:THD domain-containing protein n=1 Tax=Pinctada imbricata TaxID=66713 RepID=A0AA89BU64_PINIB|nr:hypothetical protein FSP39_006208 [Pinctada imbricata]
MGKAYRITFGISVLSNAVFLATIIITFILTRPKIVGKKIPADVPNVTVNYKSSGICVSCDILGPTVRSEETLYDDITTKCGRRVCCVKNRDNLREIVQKHKLSYSKLIETCLVFIFKDSNDTQITKENLKWWRERNSSAHLVLGDIPKKNLPLQWQSKDSIGLAFMKGLHLKDSTNIRIEQEGTYFVYTSVSYNFTGQNTKKPFYHQLRRRDHRLPNRGTQTIAMSKYGGKDAVKTTESSSFLCATVKLLSGEEIDVYFSSTSYIDNAKEKSYFGMYRLW